MSLDTSVRPDALPDTHRHPPVGLSLGALALGGFGIGTTEFATMGVLPDIAGDLGTSIPSTGHLISAYALGVVVGAPLLAVAGARLPRKAMLLGLMALFVLGNAASAMAPSYPSLLAARFVSGLPHGAYFGIASVVAASLVAPTRRGWAISMMMLGLTVANLVGVPVSTVLGQGFGWRSTFALVTVVGLLTLAAIAGLVPRMAVLAGASPLQELSALRNPQVWLTLVLGSVGFGGFFAVYSYISPTLTEVSGYRASGVPIVLALFGLGMTVGNLVGGRLADWSVDRTLGIGLVGVIVVLATFTVAAHWVVPAAVAVTLLGATGSSVIPALQARLMDAGGEAQSLAAATNHSALNLGNALGAWLGGLVIAGGYGYTAPAWVGVGLAGAGLLVLAVAVSTARRDAPRPAQALG